MRKITTFLLVFLAFIGMSSYAQDMLITAVYDGPLSGGTPKGVELYVINDIPDASIYGLGSANNGGGSDGEEFTFPSVAFNAGDFIYVASEDVQFTNWFGFPPNFTSGAMSINGDDAIELFMSGGVIDVYGDINVDGTGEPWEYMDGWAYRVDGTGPDGSTFVLSNFTYSGPNALDSETSNATAATPVPIGTYQMSFVPDPEPTNYPTNFATMGTGTWIETFWTDAIGAQLPSAYVVFISEADDIVAPVDGTPVADDLDMSDGAGAKNVNYGEEAYTFTGLQVSTVYYLTIYPYTNGGATIDFKTDGTAPESMDGTSSVLLYEDFDWSWMAWDTVNVIGDQVWDHDNSNGLSGTNCAYMNGYSGGAQDNEDWLISPRFNPSLGLNTNFSFYTAMNFSGPDLEIKWSDNYDGGGDPSTATWNDLTAILSPGGYAWTFSESIDLSSITTDIHLAFVYTSTTAGAAAWQIDNVAVTCDDYMPADIVINEIMYNSPGEDEEWIELYNNTAENIDIGGWFVQDNTPSNTPIAIPSGTVLSPDQYYTIKLSSDDNFPFIPDLDGTLQTYIYLNNGGDDVNLFSAGRLQADFVPYSDGSPWPTEPDGNGPSLSLLDPMLDNELGENWAASLQSELGTPGWKNFPNDPAIFVSSPIGGEIWEQGSAHMITWDTVNYAGQLIIELIDTNTWAPQLLVNNIPSGDLSFSWNIMSGQAPGDDYIVRISDLNGGPVGESQNTFSIIEQYIAPEIVITEIMYNPPESGNDSLEFIELYNNGIDPVDLTDFQFVDGVTYTFPAVTLNPAEFLVVGINATALSNTFGITAYEWTSGALSNSGELIQLYDAAGMFVDSVRYDDHTPWDTLADGFGPSLTLCDANLDNGLAESWAASTEFAAINGNGDSIWATPLAGCSMVMPTANFKAADTTVLVGGTTDFTDMSTGGTMVSWMWTFEGGDPATSTDQNPTGIMYATQGTYDVTLEVENDFGETSMLMKMDYISVDFAPVADFEADATNPAVGQEVHFSDLSTGTILSWNWIFQDGTPETSFLQTPEPITWAMEGQYTVLLIVANNYGQDTMEKEDYIDVHPIGISEFGADGLIKIYPNPATSILNVENTSGEDITLSIFNLTGQQILNNRIPVGSTTLNLDNLDSGIYFIRYLTESNVLETGKLIVK